MKRLAQARTALLEQVACTQGTQSVPLAKALGRVLAEDIVSALDIPPDHNSAMDGFAIGLDTVQVGVSVPVSQRVPAGSVPSSLAPGSAARIFTGGVVPDGADTVVIQENCEFNDTHVTFNSLPQRGANIRPRGQDIRQGVKVVERGKRLSPIDLSLIASVGVAKVEVIEPISVAVFSTGDELAELGQALKDGQIYNSNRALLIGLCESLGLEVVDMGVVGDTLKETKSALAEASSKADFILSSGGVSVGEEDHIKPAVEALGELDLWKIQMKPGKPVAFGRINATPFLGLPGNPVSAFVVFQLIGIPLLNKCQGCDWTPPLEFPVLADFSKKMTSREEYLRVKLEARSGKLWATPFSNSSSGVASSLSWADGLLRHEIDTAIEYGQETSFLPLRDGLI